MWLLAHPCLLCRTPSLPLSPGTLHPHLAPCTHRQGWYVPHTLPCQDPTPSPERYLFHSPSVLLLPYPFTGQSNCAPSGLRNAQALVARLGAGTPEDRPGTTTDRLSPPPTLLQRGVQKGEGARPCQGRGRTRTVPHPPGRACVLIPCVGGGGQDRVGAAGRSLACLAQILWSAFPGLHPSGSTTQRLVFKSAPRPSHDIRGSRLPYSHLLHASCQTEIPHP